MFNQNTELKEPVDKVSIIIDSTVKNSKIAENDNKNSNVNNFKMPKNIVKSEESSLSPLMNR